MNGAPPSNDGPDEVDEQYRRAAQLDRGRPSDAVRRAILEHATQRATEHAAARGGQAAGRTGPAAANDPVPLRKRSARYRSRWPLAVFGTLAVAGIAGLLVAPQLPWRLVAPGARVATQSEGLAARAPREASSPAQAPFRPEAQLQGSARTALPALPPAPLPRPQPARAAPQFVQIAPAANEAAATSSAGPAARAADAAPRAAMAAKRADLSTLRQAAETGDLARLQANLDQSVDIDAVDADGRTALMLATLNAQASAVEMLLSHGANPNIADAQGRTPLTLARSLRQPEIAAALQRAGGH
ncbi:MAG TPA: ankyrin repeat domain-containing protein [Steroidobacteraceae bacterium]|nr:ankyrin repeat domain-containing protein [Steroidobacteraceae bacterium]